MADLTQEQKIALLDEVMQDKPLYRQIVKKVAANHPDTYLPEVELDNRIDEVQAKSASEIESLKAELQKERDERAAEAVMLKVKQEHGLGDEDIGRVTKFMEDNKIGDFDAGLKFQRLSEQSDARAKQLPGDRSSMQMPTNFVDALKDRRGHRRKVLYQGLADVQRAQARAERLATH